MKFYVIDPVESEINSEGYKAFVNSPWAGQAMEKRKKLMNAKNFLRKSLELNLK